MVTKAIWIIFILLQMLSDKHHFTFLLKGGGDVF